MRSVKFNDSENIIVFDDGGMIHSNPDNTGFEIDIKVYDRLLLLAKKHEIKIPIACTAMFFDIDNIAGLQQLNTNVDGILNILSKNPDYLEIWNHGLSHQFQNEYTEFYSYSKGAISVEYQESHIKISQQIFNNLGFSYILPIISVSYPLKI